MTIRNRPEWAKAAIVAKLQEDVSDIQTDYFATRTARTVFLAWSKTARVSFRELRKAAATFPETAHLGPGRDRYTALVLLDSDVVSGGSAYYKGARSHWHREPEYGSDLVFGTLAEVDAFIAAAPPLEPIWFGDTPVAFRYAIGCQPYEHRERYSMGRGMVLGAGPYSNGWVVEKRPIYSGGDDCANLPGIDDARTVGAAVAS